MRTGITVTVSPADHDRLSGIVSEGNSPPKHVWRAEIVLSTAEGEGTSAIMSATDKSKTAVWRWQERLGCGKSFARQDAPSGDGADSEDVDERFSGPALGA